MNDFFQPVLPARQLGKRPVRVEVDGTAWALFRDDSGRPAALEDKCPHRFAPLSKGRVVNGRLACAYHGWNFDGRGEGRSPSQPLLKGCRARAAQVVERFGHLWLAPTGTTLEAFPFIDATGYQLAGSFTSHFDAPLHVALDNFSEDEHTPWVHGFLGWRESDAGAIEFEHRASPDSTWVRYVAPQRPSVYLPFLLCLPGDRFHNEWVTRFSPVHTLYSLHWTNPRTGLPRPVRAKVAVFFVPQTARTTVLNVLVFVQVPPRLAWLTPVVKAIGLRVTRQEIADDARFIPLVKDTPFEMKGMRLGKYDAPLVRNRERLAAARRGAAQVGELAATHPSDDCHLPGEELPLTELTES